MALFAYFQHADLVLPNPDGPLWMAVPANEEVKLVVDGLSSNSCNYPFVSVHVCVCVHTLVS